jgi:hypothetical protein
VKRGGLEDLLDLDSAHAKLARARSHYQALSDEVLEARLSTDGDDVIRLAVRSLDERGSTLAIIVDSVPLYPVVEWGVVVGDLLHDVRSALDHAAYQLVASGRAATEETLRESQFPICDSKSTFDDAVPRRLAGVDRELLAVVEDAQPFQYHDVLNSPLHHLRELSNRDKHRLVTPLVLASDSIPEGSFEVAHARLDSFEQLPHLPLKAGVELIRVRVTPDTGHVAELFLPNGLPTYMTLEDPAGHASFWLDGMLSRTETTLRDLREAWDRD